MCRVCTPTETGSHDGKTASDSDVPYRVGSTVSAGTLRGGWTWQQRAQLLHLRSRVLDERLAQRGAKRTEHTVVVLPDAVYTDLPVVAPPQAQSTTEFFEGMVQGA